MLQRLENIKKYIENEKNIIGILNTMSNIEKNEGKESLKIISLTELLKDFLVEEERQVNEFNNDQPFLINYISKNNLSLIDEMQASFLEENNLIQYRLFKLLNNSLKDIDLIKTDTYLELIKASNDVELKYRLCLVSPILMHLLIDNYFDHERINLSEYKSKTYEVKKLSFLIRESAEFIIFMTENNKVDNITCLNYLSVLKNSINNENLKSIFSILVKSGYDSEKINKILMNLAEKNYKKLD